VKQDLAPLLKRLAVGLLGLALITAFVSGAKRALERSDDAPQTLSAPAPDDPISAELQRCSGLTNEEAMADKKCRRAWILNRQRFFGQRKDKE